MTLHRVKSKLAFSCDQCSETLETDAREMGDARNDLVENGWQAIEVNRFWEHLCPECAKRCGVT